MIQLKLSNKNGNEGIVLNLPATPAEVSEALAWFEWIDVDFSTVHIVDVSSSISNLGPYILRANIHNPEKTNMLNKLALGIEEFWQRDGEMLKFLAVLSVEQPETVSDALRFAINLDDYERITEGAYEYGRTLLRRHGADDELLETIDGYMDFEKLGEASMAEDGVRQTEFGLIRRCSIPFPYNTQSMQIGGI